MTLTCTLVTHYFACVISKYLYVIAYIPEVGPCRSTGCLSDDVEIVHCRVRPPRYKHISVVAMAERWLTSNERRQKQV